MVSLFDDYPDRHLPTRAGACCDGLGRLPLLDQFLHVLGHSRVPFSIAQLSMIAPVTDNHEMGDAIDRAVNAGWVGHVEPEDYMSEPPDLYVGRLARRR